MSVKRSVNCESRGIYSNELKKESEVRFPLATCKTVGQTSYSGFSAVNQWIPGGTPQDARFEQVKLLASLYDVGCMRKLKRVLHITTPQTVDYFCPNSEVVDDQIAPMPYCLLNMDIHITPRLYFNSTGIFVNAQAF